MYSYERIKHNLYVSWFVFGLSDFK
jgi:hypothetical protein